MHSGTIVGTVPHARREATPTNRSNATESDAEDEDAHCACGRGIDGYDALRGEPVCRTCARIRCDGGSNLYSCETPGCKNWKEVVTPDGYVCHHCAGKLEEQYEKVGEKPVLLADGGWLDE